MIEKLTNLVVKRASQQRNANDTKRAVETMTTHRFELQPCKIRDNEWVAVAKNNAAATARQHGNMIIINYVQNLFVFHVNKGNLTFITFRAINRRSVVAEAPPLLQLPEPHSLFQGS